MEGCNRQRGWWQFALGAESTADISYPVALLRSRYSGVRGKRGPEMTEGRGRDSARGRGEEDTRCRLTLDSGVGLPYLYSAVILSYRFALRQMNRPPAYRKPSERSRDSLSRSSGPTYE